jgi:hypothetical protein
MSCLFFDEVQGSSHVQGMVPVVVHGGMELSTAIVPFINRNLGHI